jgi:hypothetical protein
MTDWLRGSLIRSLPLRQIKGPGIILIAGPLLFLLCISPAIGVLPNSPNPLENFPGDYYKMTGSPYLQVSLEKDTVYQDDNTSLLLSLKNSGNISSIRVNEDPAANAPEEQYAAKMELELERAETTAQDISVILSMPYLPNVSPLEIKRAVAYAGNLREGQVSSVLPFPIEVYKNTTPGDYILYATINYTFQSDVAVKPESDRPQNPDIYFLYDSASQVVPLKLRVERRSGAEFEVAGISPESLAVGSSDNIVKVTIENVGYDTAYDLVARLRPESGIYVSVDESPIPVIAPGEKAELVYKVDVSKDAVPDKRYMFRLLFEFSDSLRSGLTDTENVYLMISSGGIPTHLLIGALIIIIAAVAFIVIRKRKGTH